MSSLYDIFVGRFQVHLYVLLLQEVGTGSGRFSLLLRVFVFGLLLISVRLVLQFLLFPLAEDINNYNGQATGLAASVAVRPGLFPGSDDAVHYFITDAVNVQVLAAALGNLPDMSAI